MATKNLKPKSKKERLASLVQDTKTLIVDERDYVIKEASIKDDFCKYSFEIIKGNGFGDVHNVAGSGIIDDDLIHAFGKLRVHLAFIDDVFKHSNMEIKDIDQYHADDLTNLYVVTGIKITGGAANESVILKGSKHVSSAGGRIDLTSPKIPIDESSSYPWHNELKAAVDLVLYEVALYKEGKCTNVEPEEDLNPKQMLITDMLKDTDVTVIPGGTKSKKSEANDVNWNDDDDKKDDDFENAKV